MKFLAKFAALLFLTIPAMAATLAPLTIPSAVPKAYPARAFCVAASFNADDSVNGTCASQTASASSGRGGHPTYTNLLYTASWDVYGNALGSGTYCGKFVVNVPSVHIYTYAPGFTAATCYVPTSGTTQVSLYDPALGYNAWFEYVTMSPDGAYELITQGVYGYIYGFYP